MFRQSYTYTFYVVFYEYTGVCLFTGKRERGVMGIHFFTQTHFWGVCVCPLINLFISASMGLPDAFHCHIGAQRLLLPPPPPPPPHLPFPHRFRCPDNPYISALEKRQERQGRELLTIESEETAVCQEGRELSVRHKERHYAAFATETTASVV